ncbi:MAG: 2,3-bisphosphoglycerate-independent phosphoglycerate mutase [Candidatus Melainabacteria bacterium]|nr:2,3-bisphosphoglycerate-independent phosphoglycerate mutase [Candidatus Melainabacteria bacterium]
MPPLPLPATACLLILDGWGLAAPAPGNAIAQANTPHFDRLWQTVPHTTLAASGLAVGLPPHWPGNSEVGHLTIGAGRTLPQSLSRINQSIDDGSLCEHAALQAALNSLQHTTKTLHVVGLVSDGGVHSHLDHLLALLTLAYNAEVPNVRVHAILDGRDVPPQSAMLYLEALEAHLLTLDYPPVSTVCGRYYAMDRDSRWERIQAAATNLTHGTGEKHLFSMNAVERAYAQGLKDEFLPPCTVDLTYPGIQKDDVLLFANFRADRMRQLVRALADPRFDAYERPPDPPRVRVWTLTDYGLNLPEPPLVLYPPEVIQDTLPQVLSANGLSQLHVAETEKYAHVTFFMNGGVEAPVEGEARCLIPSPAVATYDLAPEMSAEAVANRVIEAIEAQTHAVVIANLANADMVGHTGDLQATIRAVEVVDHQLGRIAAAIEAAQGLLLVVADHGNAEQMLDDDLEPVCAHTANPVPFLLLDARADSPFQRAVLSENGTLSQVAATLLACLGLPKEAKGSVPSHWSPSLVSHSPLAAALSAVDTPHPF